MVVEEELVEGVVDGTGGVLSRIWIHTDPVARLPAVVERTTTTTAAAAAAVTVVTMATATVEGGLRLR